MAMNIQPLDGQSSAWEGASGCSQKRGSVRSG